MAWRHQGGSVLPCLVGHTIPGTIHLVDGGAGGGGTGEMNWLNDVAVNVSWYQLIKSSGLNAW